MEYCEFCGKILKPMGKSHQKFCKNNPNRIIRKSNFTEYNKKLKDGTITKKYSNQFIKSKELGLEYKVSDETKLKISKTLKNTKLSEDHKQKIKDGMRKTVQKNPDSYNSSNVCGRVKLIEYNGYKLHGNWELLVAKLLSENNIMWTNIVDGFEYYWNDNIHLYFPDFYLPDYNVYIEVKGYETDRDLQKWRYFPHTLIILKKNEIYALQREEIDIIKFIENAKVA